MQEFGQNRNVKRHRGGGAYLSKQLVVHHLNPCEEGVFGDIATVIVCVDARFNSTEHIGADCWIMYVAAHFAAPEVSK